MNFQRGGARETEADLALMQALSDAVRASSVPGESKASALISQIFVLMAENQAAPGKTAGVFTEMWNRHYGYRASTDREVACDLLASCLSSVIEAPMVDAQVKIGALFGSAIELAARQKQTVSEVVESMLVVWSHRFGQAPLAPLQGRLQAVAHDRARQLERLVASWGDVSLHAIVGLLATALCVVAERAQIPKRTVHGMIDDAYGNVAFPGALS
jgi:hypothetical protein